MMQTAGDFWRFTPDSAHRAFSDEFGAGEYTNRGPRQRPVFLFLQGLAAESFTRLNRCCGPDYPLVATIRGERS
jgi:hypothetical protein